MPILNNVRITQFRVSCDGNRVELVFDMPMYASNPPKKWEEHKCNTVLIKAAEEMRKNERIQQETNHLINELLGGNTNPGLGTKNLFKDITYLRGRNGARIFYRTTNEGYEILAKANKANEQMVINILKKLYK